MYMFCATYEKHDFKCPTNKNDFTVYWPVFALVSNDLKKFFSSICHICCNQVLVQKNGNRRRNSFLLIKPGNQVKNEKHTKKILNTQPSFLKNPSYFSLNRFLLQNQPHFLHAYSIYAISFTVYIPLSSSIAILDYKTISLLSLKILLLFHNCWTNVLF